MQIGMIGLGRMGGNIVRRLATKNHSCVVYDRAQDAIDALVKEGSKPAKSPEDMVKQLPKPRVVWVMLPSGKITDDTVTLLGSVMEKGDIIIDGGNSFWQDDIRRAKALAAKGIHYVDIGTSGGVWGKDRGYCMMIGGSKEAVTHLDPILDTLAPGIGTIDRTRGRSKSADSRVERGYMHCGPSGAGHFVKMVHNGIEYGLMAAYAEGLNILEHADIGKHAYEKDAETTPLRNPEHYQYEFDLAAITELWRRGSVVGSWLLDLTAQAMADDPKLAKFGGKVSDSGEGRWTLAAANDEGVPAPVLAAALFGRFQSRGNAEFMNKVMSAQRFAFGGHLEKAH